MEEDYTPILFPAYIEKDWKSRTLAFYDGHDIVTETGEPYVIHNFEQLLTTIFEHNLLTFMLDVPTFRYLDKVIDMPGSNCCCTEQGKPIGIRFKGARNTARWIINAGSWGYDGSGSALKWLKLMRRVYNRAGVGTPSTPGSLGSAIFRKSFQEQYGENWRDHRHRRPPGPYAEKIRSESSGARSEVFQLNVQFDIAYENDQHNGYGAALSQFQPSGKTYRVRGEAVRHYPMYFVECSVEIKEPLLYGVFPIREKEGRNTHPVFPREPGLYRAWLWKEEIDLARLEGLAVSIKSGYAWREVTDDFAPMVAELARLRDEASDEESGYFKLALVAFTGTLGMPTERYHLVSGDERQPGDRAIGDAGAVYDWWIHAEQNPYPQSMPHIFSHTLMLCRLSLFAMMKRATLAELNIIATNTDAVITEYRDATLALKGERVETGDWTARALHDVIVKANRHLDSREKSVHPGIPKKGRKT